jgi:hypothetical protein
LKLIKSKKTREDIINEAKLALEAKAITSKAVIAELEKIKKKTPTSSSSSPSPSRSFSSSILRRALKTRKINNNSAINRLRNRTRSKRLKMKKHLPSLSNIMSNKKTKKVANKNNEKSKLHKNQINNILIMEDEFVPSKTTNSLTTENIYK